MPLQAYVELLNVGQEFALVIPRPNLSPGAGNLYNGATENDLVGFASVISNELGRIREFLDAPTSRTWTLMLLTGGGIAIYLLCRRKLEEDNDEIILAAPDVSSIHRRGGPPPNARHDRSSRWGSASQRSWFSWLADLAYGPVSGDDNIASAVFDGQYFGPLIGPSNDTHHFGRKFDAKLIFAPCPNCLKGCCKIKKHRHVQRQFLTVGESNTSSSSTSPMRVNAQSGFAMANATSTPELADDEDSEAEAEGVLHRVSGLHKFSDRFFRPGQDERIEGDGERKNASLASRKSSSGSTGKNRSRIPPEGREKLISPSKRASISGSSARSKPPSAKDLSCGDVTCTDSFCLNNNNICNSSISNCHLDRETSVDSIANVSKGMIGLIRGAREVRRLIREASFDSTASEFSLGVSISEDLNELARDQIARARLRMSNNTSRCGSDLGSVRDYNISESEESQLDFRLIERKCASTQKHKKLWRLSAPINGSDFDSPEHQAAVGASRLVASTADASPNHHYWHDSKLPKYKMALYAGSSSVSEISEAVEGLEWDSEDIGPQFDDAASEMGSFCVDTWLEDNLELDLEAELSRFNSERSSRRNSMSSDLDSTYLYRSVRLPPSGRSSVTHGTPGYGGCGDSSCGETPQKIIDQEMLIRSFGVALSPSTSPPKEWSTRPSTMTMSTTKRGNGLKSPSYNRWKESSPIYDTSGSRRHLGRSNNDFLSTMHEQTTVTMSTSGCLLATTPLSPVHEAKEPRNSSSCKSPIDNESSGEPSSPAKRQIFREVSSCALPDLEAACNT